MQKYNQVMWASDMSAEKIGICVIGAGRAGLIHARNFAASISGSQLLAVADPGVEALDRAHSEFPEAKTFSDYRQALDCPGIVGVVVASPTLFHKDIVLAAARAGKHILCEKPMGIKVGECQKMIAATQENSVLFQMGFMRRFDESFLAAKEAIDCGRIGQVVCVKSLTHGPSVPKPWQYDIRASNGPLAEVNSHDIDTLRWFTSSEFKEVYAIAGNYRCPQAKTDFPDFYDNVLMTASFTNGMQGFIGGAVSVRYGYDARVEVLGTEGVLFVGELPANSLAVCSHKTGITRSITKSWRNLFAQAYLREDAHFVDCIREQKNPCVSGIDGMMAVKVVNAGNQSIAEGRPVQLN